MRKYFAIATGIFASLSLLSGVMLAQSAHAGTAPSYGYVIGFDGKCLDAANAFGNPVPAAGYRVQMWSCFALHGEDQQFAIVQATGTTFDNLEYQAPNGPYCVDSDAEGNVTITACNANSTLFALTNDGNGNEYAIQNSTNDTNNEVLNVKGASLANGAPVMAYPDYTQVNDQFMRPVHF